MDKNRNYLSLKKFCLAQGADLFGVADITNIKDGFLLSHRLQEKLTRAVILGVRLSDGILEEIEKAPSKIYFHHYRTLNSFLDQLALQAARFIQKKNFLSLPVPASQIVDWQNQKAHLSHKQLGILAGLGWLGRNNLLVNSALGSRLRLASILTDMPLKAGRPLKKGCGDCNACVNTCPAQAIKENSAEFNHQRCFEKLKEFQKQHIVEQYICGVCVKACRGKR